jgi:MFS family permease
VRKAVTALGATNVSTEDIRRGAAALEAAEAPAGRRFRGWTPAAWRALAVVCVFFIFQRITGINAASTYLGFRWIDKYGRRKLAIGGYAGMVIFALVAALGLAFLSGIPRLVVIMIGLDFFIASFAVGVGGTGWTLQGEVFPTAVRGQAAAIAATVDWLANFALIEVFPVWQNAISLAGVLVCFAALCLAAIAFIFWFLPETKGLPVEDIVALFRDRRQRSAAHQTLRRG